MGLAGQSELELPAATLGLGWHVVRAEYAGDEQHEGASAGPLFVDIVNAPPLLTSVAPVEVQQGKSVQVPIEVSDTDAEDVLTVTVVLGPEGLTVDSQAHILTFAPAATLPLGKHAALVRVTDLAGAFAEQRVELNVLPNDELSTVGGGCGCGAGGVSGGAAWGLLMAVWLMRRRRSRLSEGGVPSR